MHKLICRLRTIHHCDNRSNGLLWSTKLPRCSRKRCTTAPVRSIQRGMFSCLRWCSIFSKIETPVDEPLPLDIEFHNSRYQTFVHVAAEARRADLLRQIYTFFPRVNYQYLIYFCKNFFFLKKVSLDLRDAFGASPLHIAAALNDAECVEVLVVRCQSKPQYLFVSSIKYKNQYRRQAQRSTT